MAPPPQLHLVDLLLAVLVDEAPGYDVLLVHLPGGNHLDKRRPQLMFRVLFSLFAFSQADLPGDVGEAAPGGALHAGEGRGAELQAGVDPLVHRHLGPHGGGYNY